jgi:hypothetical protein
VLDESQALKAEDIHKGSNGKAFALRNSRRARESIHTASKWEGKRIENKFAKFLAPMSGRKVMAVGGEVTANRFRNTGN